MKESCSDCGKELRKLDDASVHGFNHRTSEPYFTCRKCLMLAGAKANLELAYRRLELSGVAPTRALGGGQSA